MPKQLQANYILKGVSGRDTVRYELTAGTTTTIPRAYQTFMLDRGSAGDMIAEHQLQPNYPNPFNPATTIRYQVASQADITVEVYNILGQKVRTLVDQQQTPGSYTVRFDGSNLSSGMYFIQLKAGNKTDIQKMTLVK
ncbi:MAG: T9SS type A sorting domain-containing protein [Fodinibius sp.]|nr:T9SS type A sorting domain-containing protein [Fodinibius sp.]